MQDPAPDEPAELTERRAGLAALLPALRGYARFLALDRAEADDLVQEALVRALAALPQFEPAADRKTEGAVPGAELKAWSFTILRNVFYAGKRRQRTERGALVELAGSPEARPGDQEAQASLGELSRAMARLPPEQREALMLVGAQELDHATAARICGVAVGTMKARVSRGRARLAALLNPSGST
jgi:RNA polymerase sigma-70 factor (ECF subfamily)